MAGEKDADRTAEKRRRLLEAGERLFSERYYANTQVAAIAKAAGTGVGTFYANFPDKEALLSELLESMFLRIREDLAGIRQGIERRTPMEQMVSVRRTYEVVFRALLSRPRLSSTFLHSGLGASERVSAAVWAWVQSIVHDIIADVVRTEQAGILRVPDKETFGHCLVGMVLQLAHKIILEGEPAEEQAVDFCTRMTFGMLSTFIPDDLREKMLPVYTMLLPPVEQRGP